MAKRKKTDVVQLKLRLTESLRKKLEVGARARNRSLNSEILHRLEWTFWPQVERRMDAEVYAELLAGSNRDRTRPEWRNLVDAVMMWSEGPASPAPLDLAPPAPTSPTGDGTQYRKLAAEYLRLAEATPGEARGTLQEMARLWSKLAERSVAAGGPLTSNEINAAMKDRDSEERLLRSRIEQRERAYDVIKQHGGHLTPAERDRLRTLVDRAASEGDEPELPLPQRDQAKGEKS